ncbi:hypothetical protein ABGB07_42335 [Micromonosporaceae bacterium B7E4]
MRSGAQPEIEQTGDPSVSAGIEAASGRPLVDVRVYRRAYGAHAFSSPSARLDAQWLPAVMAGEPHHLVSWSLRHHDEDHRSLVQINVTFLQTD